MLLLISTNPTVDRLIDLPHLIPSRVHRSPALHLSAGGKSLNVARAALTLGQTSQITVGFLAGHSGQILADLVESEGLPCEWHRSSSGETKMSHLLLHDGGDTTVINEPGPTMSTEDWRSLESLIWKWAPQSRAIVLAGTTPPGISTGDYLELCHSLVSITTSQVFIDTQGKNLQAVLSSPQGLAIKVNQEELSQALGRDLNDTNSLISSLKEIISQGAHMMGVTLGSKGAILADIHGVYRIKHIPNPQRYVSTVGSGDSFTAGLVTGYLKNLSKVESLQLATACGLANVESSQPAKFSLERVHELCKLIEVECISGNIVDVPNFSVQNA